MNTNEVLNIVIMICRETGIDKVVVASETGRSALRALSTSRGTGIELVIVTHTPAKTWSPKEDIPR